MSEEFNLEKTISYAFSNYDLRLEVLTAETYLHHRLGIEFKNLTADRDRLAAQLGKVKETLEFYSSYRNFEMGKIHASDIEPTYKIEGRPITHTSIPDKVIGTWAGGKRARAALKEMGES